MLVSKFVEIRDVGTLIPAIAFKVCAESEPERWLMARAGFMRSVEEQMTYVFLMRLTGSEDGVEVQTDPFKWGRATMHLAHLWIRDNFDSLVSGQVVDVEYVNGWSPAPKASAADEGAPR